MKKEVQNYDFYRTSITLKHSSYSFCRAIILASKYLWTNIAVFSRVGFVAYYLKLIQNHQMLKSELYYQYWSHFFEWILYEVSYCIYNWKGNGITPHLKGHKRLLESTPRCLPFSMNNSWLRNLYLANLDLIIDYI